MIGKRDSVNMVINKIMNNANGIGTSKTEARANSDTVGQNGQQISTQAHSLKSMDNLRSITNQLVNFVKENNEGRVSTNLNNETIKDFINQKIEDGLSGSSVNTYISELSKISDNLNQLGVNETSREAITEYREQLKESGFSLARENNDRTNQNSQELVNFMKENSPYGLEAELQKVAGLRSDDVLNLSEKITVNEDNSLFVECSKNGLDYTTIPLSQDLADRTREAINQDYKVSYSEYRETLKEGAEATGNEWNGTHSLRFDYANDQRAEGKTLSEISDSMGHSRSDVVLRYLT